jgi:trehalose 6-phosphate phosphatase
MKSLPPLSGEMAFFLDVDGTLMDYADHPRAVHVGATLLHLLDRLRSASSGALALISGRSIEDLDSLFAPLVLPAAGQHGTELRLATGELRSHAPPIEMLGRAAAEIVRVTAAHQGLLFENKGMTLALHYRMAPQKESLVERTMRDIVASMGNEFGLQVGKFVYEIRPTGKDKGTAIAEFMREAPFAGREPVFVGDDLTDEYGFDAVNAMGGHSVKVGKGKTGAQWQLDDAAAVLAWLGDFVERCGTDRARAGTA